MNKKKSPEKNIDISIAFEKQSLQDETKIFIEKLLLQFSKLPRRFAIKIYQKVIKKIFVNFESSIKQNNTIKNIYLFWIQYFFTRFFLFFSRGDRFKHWDSLKEINLVTSYIGKRESLLFCAIGKNINILKYFKSIGYEKIFAFDITLPEKYLRYFCKRNKIKITFDDIYNLKYTKKFKYISLLSFVEHIDNYELMFNNLKNVSQDGTILLVTTDYWPEKINTKDIFPYGKENPAMKIFSKEEILEFVNIAKKNNFHLMDNNIDFSTTKKYVKWNRVKQSYTFISLTFTFNEN